jgi:DNA-binding MarR family transcriptional regulator
MSAEHGLTLSEYEALLRLSQADENALRRVDLARELLLTPSGVTRLLEGLERAGYVEKGVCTTDARVTYAVLTDVGREKIEAAAETHLAQVCAIFDERFTEQEQHTLGELLGRLSGEVDPAECSVGSQE